MSTPKPDPPGEAEALKSQVRLLKSQNEKLQSEKAALATENADLAAQIEVLRAQTHKIRVTLKGGSVLLYRGDAFEILHDPERVEFRQRNPKCRTYAITGFRNWSDVTDVALV